MRLKLYLYFDNNVMKAFQNTDVSGRNWGKWSNLALRITRVFYRRLLVLWLLMLEVGSRTKLILHWMC